MLRDECGEDAGETEPERFDIGPGSGPFFTEGTGRDRGDRRHGTSRFAVHVRERIGEGHGEGLSFSVWLPSGVPVTRCMRVRIFRSIIVPR